MVRAIVNVVLLLVIALLGWYFIAPNIICWQEGGSWSLTTRECSLGTTTIPGEDLMPQVSQMPRVDLNKLKELIIHIPDSEGTTATLARTNENLDRFMATFAQNGSPVEGSAEALAELAVTDTTTGMSLIPFVVNFGGSGSFIYIGLFEHASTTLVHRDSFLVGDRVSIENVSFERAGVVIKAVVLYKDRKTGEPMTSTPTTPQKMVVEITASTFGEPTIYDRETAYKTSYKDLVKIETPAPFNTVSSPVTIRGVARGPWFFEASFPIKIVTDKGITIGSGIAQADGEWMTTDYVPFTAIITFTKGGATEGEIIIAKDNPSGMPENDDSFIIPVKF